MSEKYDELRAVYMAAKADFVRIETELAIARAKMSAAEREAVTEWRKLTNPEKIGALTGVSLTSTTFESGV